MAWIKRNLFFVIGSVVAVGLLAAAGFYLFTRNQANNSAKEKLSAAYAELDQLNSQKPHPGNAKIDNVAAAQQQRQELLDFINKAGQFFQPIPAIPNNQKPISDYDFASALRETIDQLQRDANTGSVTLPPHYDFSFTSIKNTMNFAPGSLAPLAVQLGEVKAISEVLFQAKVNSMDSIRRVRVSPDDKEMSDYIEMACITNNLAVLTPYEVTFRCFTPELAEVLTSYSYSDHGFIVKEIHVAPAGAAPLGEAAGLNQPVGGYPLPYGGVSRAAENARAMIGRTRGFYPPAAVAPAPRGGLSSVIDEQLLKVTLVLDVVKLIPPAK